MDIPVESDPTLPARCRPKGESAQEAVPGWLPITHQGGVSAGWPPLSSHQMGPNFSLLKGRWLRSLRRDPRVPPAQASLALCWEHTPCSGHPLLRFTCESRTPARSLAEGKGT